MIAALFECSEINRSVKEDCWGEIDYFKKAMTCTQLFNLGLVHVEGAVNPGQQIMATEVITSY